MMILAGSSLMAPKFRENSNKSIELGGFSMTSTKLVRRSYQFNTYREVLKSELKYN